MNERNPLLQQFIDELAGQSETNRRNYRHRVSSLLRHARRPLDEIGTAEVNRWLREMENDGYSPVTVAGYRQATKAFFGWCVEQGVLACSPANHLRIRRVVPDVVHIPDEGDVRAVTAVALRWSHEDDYCRRRAAFVWLYCLESGCRRGGLLALRVAQIADASPLANGVFAISSREKGQAVIHQFTAVAMDAGRRMLELRPKARNKMLLVGVRAPYRPLSESGISRDFISICAEARVRTIRSHALRHRLGDKLTREYSPKLASKKLNHADIQTTLLWYHRADMDDVAEATAEQAAGF